METLYLTGSCLRHLGKTNHYRKYTVEGMFVGRFVHFKKPKEISVFKIQEISLKTSKKSGWIIM